MVSSNVEFSEELPWELKRTSAQPLQQTTLLSLTGWPQQKVGSAADDEAAQWTDARGTPAQWMDHAIG